MVAARAYVPDTVVVDPAELDVQVQLVGDDGKRFWHRPLPGSGFLETVCEMLIELRMMTDKRIEECSGEMCPGCFMPVELARAAQENARRRIRLT